MTSVTLAVAGLVVGLVAPITSAAQAPPSPLYVDVPGVVEVVWRNVIDRLGQTHAVPFFLPALPDDLARAAEVVKTDEAFRAAKLHNDTDALARLLRDEFYQINQNGNGRDKQQMLELWKHFPIRSLETERATLRFADHHASMSGEQVEVNATGIDRMLFTRVYVRGASGEWQLLSSTQFRNPVAPTAGLRPEPELIQPQR